jgi:hypothetical protein
VNSTSLQISPDVEEQEGNGCVHYWVIDVPSGPVSGGKCRVCGEKKEFRNSLESGFAWDEERTTSQASVAGRQALNQLGRVEAMSEVEE